MARAELEELYRILVDGRFVFIPRGAIHLREIYAIVKERYPELCDDTYLCSTNCKSGYNSFVGSYSFPRGCRERAAILPWGSRLPTSTSGRHVRILTGFVILVGC